MPMSFPDMRSLEQAADVWDLRKPSDGETEEQYREALADHVVMHDPVESMEIRSSRGWDNWNRGEEKEALRRTMFAAPPGTLKTLDEEDVKDD